ncbi:hypothetical protein [Marinobacterium iners]|uniref:hypothetical protein n=1 Tax=Marinobacterium iners TaxID=48076 RepID=UPI001A8E5441|nr:hypothetical protein [Marinobacterium iners]
MLDKIINLIIVNLFLSGFIYAADDGPFCSDLDHKIYENYNKPMEFCIGYNGGRMTTSYWINAVGVIEEPDSVTYNPTHTSTTL